ncbi:MAG: acetylxylan esterase [Chloroflexi bacterium]|nr:acetylxylan esterase [Chloroflexota bacterium]
MPRPSPESYPSSVTRPADFDAFWAGVLAEVDAIPLAPTFTPAPLRSTPEVDTFDVRFTSLGGLRIAAWYCRPAGHQGPLPGLLIVPGYVSEPLLPKAWAAQGYATLSLAPRGKLRSNDRFNPGYPGLLTHNIVDRSTYGYRGFYADAYRALDVLCSRSEVDPSRVGVHGSSQGGALTVLIAALRAGQIACGAAGAPYLCGFMDSADLTHSYPYQEINDYLRLYPERATAARETVAYFDIINFAPQITCPMLVNIGLEDDVCPPETGFALARAMTQARVDFHVYPNCAHDAGSAFHGRLVSEFLAEHLRPGAVAAAPGSLIAPP